MKMKVYIEQTLTYVKKQLQVLSCYLISRSLIFRNTFVLMQNFTTIGHIRMNFQNLWGAMKNTCSISFITLDIRNFMWVIPRSFWKLFLIACRINLKLLKMNNIASRNLQKTFNIKWKWQRMRSTILLQKNDKKQKIQNYVKICMSTKTRVTLIGIIMVTLHTFHILSNDAHFNERIKRN